MAPEIDYEETAQCRLPADLRCVRPALDKLGAYCRARGLRPAIWAQVELAVAEGLNNAVEHGCVGKEDGQVLLRWIWHGKKLSVEIDDPSDYLPEMGEATLPEDLFAEGGRGAFLMASLMDRVEHLRAGQGHLLRLEKTVGVQTWTLDDAAEMEATLESMAEDLSRSYEDLSALFRFAEELATSTTLAEFLDRSLNRLTTLVAGQDAYVRLISDDGAFLELASPAPHGLPGLESRLPLDTQAIAIAAFKKGKSITVEDCSTLPSSDLLHCHSGGAFACPIFFRSTALGCLVVTRSNKSGYFSASELGLIRVVADFLGIVQTTNALQEQRQAQQRAQRELEIASSIQQSLLPRTFPDNGNYRVHGICQSAQEVGGDYFDALELPDGGILLVIADVMGKGVPAALLATVLRTAIHGRLNLASQPGQLLTEVNRQIAGDLSRLDMFITAQVAYLSCKEHTLLLANAGHCPLLHCQAGSNQVVQSQCGGIPLGVLEDFEYPTESHSIDKGDRLVFLTDGLYEVENAGKQMLGIEALATYINSERSGPLVESCDRILSFVREYAGQSVASDDRTLLTFARL
ncbi:MAG: SpoIIE family protein phosphatase [Verrucomicrobiota bacterium]